MADDARSTIWLQQSYYPPLCHLLNIARQAHRGMVNVSEVGHQLSSWPEATQPWGNKGHWHFKHKTTLFRSSLVNMHQPCGADGPNDHDIHLGHSGHNYWSRPIQLLSSMPWQKFWHISGGRVVPVHRLSLLSTALISWDIDGWVRDCSNSSALAMELMQFCTEPSIYTTRFDPSYEHNLSWLHVPINDPAINVTLHYRSVYV